jgi:aminoglycoside 6'-N-acetyltransferase I
VCGEEKVNIRRAGQDDGAHLAALAKALWPKQDQEVLRQEMAELCTQREAALFLAECGAQAVGFAQCQLRRDYVEGTHSSPVGYLEGIYVCPALRGRHVGLQLLKACENWARTMGCLEFASDCTIENTGSQAFHQKADFTQAARIVCFTKRL